MEAIPPRVFEARASNHRRGNISVMLACQVVRFKAGFGFVIGDFPEGLHAWVPLGRRLGAPQPSRAAGPELMRLQETVGAPPDPSSV